jgi:hypothetical protein
MVTATASAASRSWQPINEFFAVVVAASHSGRFNLGEFFPQVAGNEKINIVEHVANGVTGIPRQASQVGLVPATRIHIGR